MQRNGIVHNNQIVSGFDNDAWTRSDAGMLDMSHVGGPHGITETISNTLNGVNDEWADMFAHWVNL